MVNILDFAEHEVFVKLLNFVRTIDKIAIDSIRLLCSIKSYLYKESATGMSYVGDNLLTPALDYILSFVIQISLSEDLNHIKGTLSESWFSLLGANR